MRTLAAITARELRANAPIGIAALVTATLPWITPLLPGVAAGAAQDVRVTASLLLAALFGLALAVFTGAALLARDVADGRIGFFLTLPVRAGTIWSGRLIAAALLVYGGMALVLLPALLAWRAVPREVGAALGGLLAVPLLLVLLANHFAIGLRSRSPWLILDLGALALAGLVAARALLRLRNAAATTELALAAATVGALVVIALLVSGGFALRRGGVLLRQLHRAQMTAVVTGMAVAALLAAGYTSWVLGISAADVSSIAVASAAPAGTWIVAVPRLRHRPSFRPWMLYDTASGRSLTVADVSLEGCTTPTFAADGTSAARVRSSGEVDWIDLGARPAIVPTGITVRGCRDAVVVPRHERLAVADRGQLTVWGERGRRLLAAASLPKTSVGEQAMRFVGTDRVRLVRVLDGPGGQAVLQRFELAFGGRLTRAPDVVLEQQYPIFFTFSAAGDRLLLRQGFGAHRRVDLLGFSSAEPQSLLDEHPASGATDPALRWNQTAGAFLGDGRIAVAVVDGDQARLRLLARDGRLLRELALGEAHSIWLGAPWTANRLPYTVTVPAPRGSGQRHVGELREVDLTTGAVRAVAARLLPLSFSFWNFSWWNASADQIAPGAPASLLFLDHGGALVRLTPAGERHQVLPLPG